MNVYNLVLGFIIETVYLSADTDDLYPSSSDVFRSMGTTAEEYDECNSGRED